MTRFAFLRYVQGYCNNFNSQIVNVNITICLCYITRLVIIDVPAKLLDGDVIFLARSFLELDASFVGESVDCSLKDCLLFISCSKNSNVHNFIIKIQKCCATNQAKDTQNSIDLVDNNSAWPFVSLGNQ